MSNRKRVAINLNSVHFESGNKTVSTRHLPLLNINCNVHTLLHEERTYLFLAAALTMLAADKIDFPLERVEEIGRTTMALMR